ncbi:hypothetical protein TWF730_004473 [Orbilia blumenaviensis]|uniref:AAA-ATPase-like domain-containing protein n=1 Tax=Orbilia blumenaviensis TaxID=1796055 RepID=A0AAV9U1T8_9PEZI
MLLLQLPSLAIIRSSLTRLASNAAPSSPFLLSTRSRPVILRMAMSNQPDRKRDPDSSVINNGKPKYFRSGVISFQELLRRDGQVYFDRTGYIYKLHELDRFILFCRPRRFGKTLTVGMLEHFHGLQYADDHKSLYKGLDVQNDIDEENIKPGQYLVLTFDFSTFKASQDLAEMDQHLTKILNDSIEYFYERYALFLGQKISDLLEEIDEHYPDRSLGKCVRIVQRALQTQEKKEIKGIYMLVDEYDAFCNRYLDLYDKKEIVWHDTPAEQTFKSFWSAVKYWSTKGIDRVFITGISPLSLSTAGGVFNVTRNVSFHEDLAGLCGLKNSEIATALKEIGEHSKKISKDTISSDKHLSEMTKSFNGYHFCKHTPVDNVYNTETCLQYFQDIFDGGGAETADPAHSEVSKEFLHTTFATEPELIKDCEKALECRDDGDFTGLKYTTLPVNITLHDLKSASPKQRRQSWHSLMVYFGGFTFHSEYPKKYLKIPNLVAASRITAVITAK